MYIFVLGKLPFMTGEIIFIDSGDMVFATMFSALSFYQGHEITLHPSVKVGGITCYNGLSLQSIPTYKEQLVA